MSRKGLIQRNLKRISLFKKFQFTRFKLKNLIMNKNISLEKRFKYQKDISQLPRNGAKVRIRNRCIITGRPRGVYKIFMISRIYIRKLASIGQLPGLRKSSW